MFCTKWLFLCNSTILHVLVVTAIQGKFVIQKLCQVAAFDCFEA